MGKVEEARPIAQQWADCLTAGESEAAIALLDEHVRYEIIGKTPVSGVCYGKDEFLQRIAAVIGAFPKPPIVKCSAVISEGDRAVVLGSGRGEGPHGAYIQDHYAWVMRVGGEKIAEMTEFLDTVALESAGFGNYLAKRNVEVTPVD